MSESLLKKEFKEKDIRRARNLISKDYTANTKIQTGYKAIIEKHGEGDIWEESGKKWTIKNGIKQNITKLNQAKEAIRIPLTCPNCGKPLKHWLDRKMYKIHGYCFDPCTVEYEAGLRKAGLYEQYEQRMMQGNMKAFIEDVEKWALEQTTAVDTFVTEQGDIEDWNSNSSEKAKLLENVKQYVEHLGKYIK